MRKKEILLDRLQEIARSIERSKHALAVITLGSVGQDTHRLDDFSDLDFFVIAEDGYKDRYINDLDWLSGIAPVAYQYRNTVDGYKVLFRDRVFCEFAVFELRELKDIPFAPGRTIWKREGIAESISIPAQLYSSSGSDSIEWLLGEILSNLYVGLSRYCRGEKLSAARFVQDFAVAKLIELYEASDRRNSTDRDPFSNERRFEKRYPEFALMLPKFIQGYGRTQESAREIVNYLNARYKVNAEMRRVLLELCECNLPG